MRIWGIHKKYKTMSWAENFLGEHINIGPITIYGANAMNWAVNISTKKWGYICFSLPFPTYMRRMHGNYFYISPNGTPWASTFYRGKDKEQRVKSVLRRVEFGHGFNTDTHYKRMMAINNA